MKKLTLPLLLLLFITMVAHNVTARYKTDNKAPYKTYNFDMPAGGRLLVNTSGGSITVTGTSQNKATVEVYITGQNGTTDKTRIEEKLKNYTLNISKEKNTLTAEAKPKQATFIQNNQLRISFKISLPKSTAATLNTSGGGISFSNLAGDASIQTSGGSISVKNHSGKLKAETSGGSISVADASGNLKVHTSGGSIKLTNVAGNVDARTSGGSIQADIRELGKFLILETDGGSVTATIPNGKGLDLDITGNSVQALLGTSFKGLKEKNRIKGSVNGGGIPIKMTTSGGSARLNYRT